MAVQRIEGLRADNWQASTNVERLQALQELENGLAITDGREPCTVAYLPDRAYQTETDRANLRGSHYENTIYINEGLVSADQPYMATETLLHEDRHDYQDHVAANPELAENAQQLQDFQQNTGDGYLSPEVLGDDYYLAQPIEMDARATARERTEELYAGEFQDQSHYPAHRAKMEAEEVRNREFCEDHLGEDYEQVARVTAYTRYEQQTQQQVESSPGAEQEPQINQPAGSPGGGPAGGPGQDEPGESAGSVPEEGSADVGESVDVEAAAEEISESAEETSPSQESGESQDYDYGMGY